MLQSRPIRSLTLALALFTLIRRVPPCASPTRRAPARRAGATVESGGGVAAAIGCGSLAAIAARIPAAPIIGAAVACCAYMLWDAWVTPDGR